MNIKWPVVYNMFQVTRHAWWALKPPYNYFLNFQILLNQIKQSVKVHCYIQTDKDSCYSSDQVWFKPRSCIGYAPHLVKYNELQGGRGGTPIFGHGGEVPQWSPPFWRFSIRMGPYFIRQHNPIDPLFLQKKSVCFCLNHI